MTDVGTEEFTVKLLHEIANAAQKSSDWSEFFQYSHKQRKRDKNLIQILVDQGVLTYVKKKDSSPR